jgi:mono/diheme cytochrome c family protein
VPGRSTWCGPTRRPAVSALNNGRSRSPRSASWRGGDALPCPAARPFVAGARPGTPGLCLFQQNCLACHRLNGAGDAQFGPDLNLPHNPTEYFQPTFLRQYIRDPQSLRQWPQARMPGFSTEVLSEQELDALLAYLGHMAGRKK